MRRWYSLLIYCAVPFAFGWVLWRGVRDRGYWRGLSERFGYGRRAGGWTKGGATAGGSAPGSSSAGSCAGTVWVHAVSLGEMSAAAPLVRALRARHPQIPLVLTTATPTGRARAIGLYGDSVDVRFLPYDTPRFVARFLDRVQPRVAILMETELWPNLFTACERRGVPLVLASARLSDKSVARYQRFGSLFRGIVSGISWIAAQTPEDGERFVAIGARSARTQVTGNIKFDLEVSAAVVAKGREVRDALGSARPVWVAGSTHAGEEELVLAAHAELLAAHAELPAAGGAVSGGATPGGGTPGGALLLLAPRHPDRFEAVAAMLAERRMRFTRWSSGVMPEPGTAVVLVDSVGELATLYAAADVAFVGGSLVPIGGHNLLEPAALGVPVLTGPHYSNARDIARLLIAEGAARQVNDAAELTAALAALLADPALRQRMGSAGRRIIEANRGSSLILLELIDPLLRDPPAAAAAARPSASC